MALKQAHKMEFCCLPVMLILFYIFGFCDSVTDQQDVAALMALRQEWGFDRLPWNGNPCESHWLGVACDSPTNTKVVSLVLPSMQLSGGLPPDVGSLANLNSLDLSFNNISGPIPKQLGKLLRLTSLSLQSCQFTGSIPSELGNLQNLTFLALNGNRLTGSIPHSIGLLSKIYWLDLAFNQLSGSLPVSTDSNNLGAGLDNLTNAFHFHLNGNSFGGNIPAAIFNKDMSLIHLLLDDNDFEGEIPKEIEFLQDIDILKLDHNKLSGAVPSTISRLVTLSELHLSNNHFTGELPDLSKLTKLQILDLSSTGFDSSPVPLWFSSLPSLTSLVMQRGNLTGEVPPAIFDQPHLQAVNFDHNSVDGTLTIENTGGILLLVSMQYNDINDTSFTGYKGTLLLQGNPVCEGPNGLPGNICTSSVGPSWSPPSSNCGTCPRDLVPNPYMCKCADPYQGYFFFRAPKFSIINDTQVQTLVNAVSNALNLISSQVYVSGASFSSAGSLTVNTSFFPNNEAWSQPEIQKIASVLSNANATINYPAEFGPPLFVPYPYKFIVIQGGTGLSKGGKIGIAVGVVVLVLILFAVSIYAILQKRRADKAWEQSKPFASWSASGGESGNVPRLKGARWFSYSELKKATNNFSEANEIGMGGYGKVYKGVLLSGEQVAIKRATKGSLQGAAEFKNEIELLSRVHHKNVVGLVGFCFEQGEQMLVYEYIPNGTLRDNLLGRTGLKMDWQRRLKIALGSARGITYLHELANPPIIHRDIKSSNILLDEKNIAKVADFGLSKVGPDEDTGKGHVSTQVKGTLGYLDPEYYMTQQLTEKSDVYSFGVVLLELISARQPIERGKYIVREVRTALDKGGVSALRPLLDPRLDDYPIHEFQKFLDLALRCVEETAALRPTMNDVVKELELLIGHDYPDSMNANVKKDGIDPYAPDSQFMKKETDPSFHYSGGYIVTNTVVPK